MHVTTIGVDLAKRVFAVHGVDHHGKAVLRKTLRREQMVPFFTRLPSCMVAMEACGSAHYWARTPGILETHREVDRPAVCQTIRQGQQNGSHRLGDAGAWPGISA